jgi:predicted nucleic acid-binding protein
MQFILDCSIAMAWCFEDEASPAGDALLERLVTGSAVVPPLWYWEVANVLNVAARRGRLTGQDVAARLALLGALAIVADDDATARAWRETLLLAEAETLTVYDAAYLELALRRNLPLASHDRALRSAAARRGVAVLP